MNRFLPFVKVRRGERERVGLALDEAAVINFGAGEDLQLSSSRFSSRSRTQLVSIDLSTWRKLEVRPDPISFKNLSARLSRVSGTQFRQILNFQKASSKQ